MVVVWYNDDTVCNLNFGKDVRKIMLENKLGITDATELDRTQESISKQKALEMFESGFLILPVSCEKSIFQKEIFALHH